LAELRPHALYDSDTASVKMSVPPEEKLEKIYILTQHFWCSSNEQGHSTQGPNLKKLPILSNNLLDLSSGGIVLGIFEVGSPQCLWEGFTYLPKPTQSTIKSTLLFTQAKHENTFNNKGEVPTNSILSLSFIQQHSADLKKLVTEQDMNVFIDYVSDRDLTGLESHDIPKGVSIIHKGNFTQCMGIFGQITPVLKENVHKVLNNSTKWRKLPKKKSI